MPGDPKEARTHASNCMQLAETASSPTLQKTFADLAKQWNRLANELDDAPCASQSTERVRPQGGHHLRW